MNFAVLWLFANVFSAKFVCVWGGGGGGVFWCGKSEQSMKVFSTKIVFFTNSRKFSPLKVSRYTVLDGGLEQVVGSK